MPLEFRLARPSEFDELRRMVIDSFEPVTWFRKVDALFGPLNGHDWRDRWNRRLDTIFASQIVLVGETGGRVVAFASGVIEERTRLGYIDLLAVDRACQRRGYGRRMLRAMLQHMKEQGAVHAYLDCLSDNEPGNRLYRSEGFQEVATHIRWFIKIPSGSLDGHRNRIAAEAAERHR